MKLVLLAILVMIGATAYVLWRDQNRLPLQTLLPSAHSASAKPADAPQRALQPEHRAPRDLKKPADSAAKGPPPSVPAEQPVAEAPKTLAPPPLARRPFPNADQVALGAGEEAITGRYGSPSAWVVSSNHGHLTETLVYTQERGVSATVIRVVDGRVAAAYSKAEPAAPPGSLVRTFDLQD